MDRLLLAGSRRLGQELRSSRGPRSRARVGPGDRRVMGALPLGARAKGPIKEGQARRCPGPP